jgi:glucose-specific phosphotransferase system IIA component
MLKMFKKKAAINRHPGEIFATQDGTAVPLSEVPDEVISAGILGDGAAIVPSSGKVVMPVDGTVTSIAKTKHAFCIQSSDGLELLIHIGVDTVQLGGRGFKVFVKEGEYVLAGTQIGDVDLELLKEHDISSHTAILISNPGDFSKITPAYTDVEAGASTVIKYDSQTAKGVSDETI